MSLAVTLPRAHVSRCRWLKEWGLDTQSRLPFESYLGTVRVTDSGNDTCEIDWSSTFDAVGLPEVQITAMIEDLYVQAIEGLEKLHQTASSRQLKP